MIFKKLTEIALEKGVALLDVERLAHLARVATRMRELALSSPLIDYERRAKRAISRLEEHAAGMNLEIRWPALAPEFADIFILKGERVWWRFMPREQ